MRKGIEEVSEHLSGEYSQINAFKELPDLSINTTSDVEQRVVSKSSSPKQLASLLSLTETLDALPALGQNNVYEAELYSREQELSQRAQDISVKELGIRRQSNRLQLIKERLSTAERKLEQDQQTPQGFTVTITRKRARPSATRG